MCTNIKNIISLDHLVMRELQPISILWWELACNQVAINTRMFYDTTAVQMQFSNVHQET